jgi:hypothetical protein
VDFDGSLYALLVRATAGDGCEHEPGTARDVLVVARAETQEEAHQQALRVLNQHGWLIAEVRRQAPITTDVTSETGYLGRAVRAALEHGAQIVVYDR